MGKKDQKFPSLKLYGGFEDFLRMGATGSSSFTSDLFSMNASQYKGYWTTSFYSFTEEKISWKSVKIMCVWIWLYSVIWAMFPVLGWGRYGPEPFGISCSLAWGQMKNEGFSFVIAMFSFNLVLPAVIIMCCYLGITINLYFTYKKAVNHSNDIPIVIKLQRRLLTVCDHHSLIKVLTNIVLPFGFPFNFQLIESWLSPDDNWNDIKCHRFKN